MMKMPGMYSCQEVHDFVSRGELAELSIWNRMRFQMHVMMCHHCSRYVKQIAAVTLSLRRIFGSLPDPERCQHLEDAVMAQCDGQGE